MKALLIALAVGVSALITVPHVSAQGCGRLRERKEWRQLSGRERTAYISAVRSIHSGPKPTIYDSIVKIHLDQAPTTHTWPLFFPFHREYIRNFERELQKVDPSVILAYWDWSIDSQTPSNSPVWNDYGHSGGEGQCVLDGSFSGWQAQYNLNGTDLHCLRRAWNQGTSMGSVFPPEYLEQNARDNDDYVTFWNTLERGPHGIVHAFIGGDMFDMASPNDPIFWLHHTFLDKLWAEWQQKNANTRLAYGGNNADGSAVSLDDAIPGFNVSVRDVMDTRNSGYCYIYSDSSNVQGTGIAGSSPARADDTTTTTTTTTTTDTSTAVPVTSDDASGADTSDVASRRRRRIHLPRGYVVELPEAAQQQPDAVQQPDATNHYVLNIGGQNYRETWGVINLNRTKRTEMPDNLHHRQLTVPTPIPLSFIQCMKYDEKAVRKQEADLAVMINSCNALFNSVTDNYNCTTKPQKSYVPIRPIKSSY